MKKATIIILIALIAVIGWQVRKRILQAGKLPLKTTDTSVPVETREIETGSIRDIGVFSGSLIPKSQFIVAPKVSGWLKKLLVNVGDTVERNQLIAVLDGEEFSQQVEQAKAELQVAQANAANSESELELAQREYERAKALREKQIASVSELDESEAAYTASQSRLKVSQALVDQKQSSLQAAQLRLSYTQVRAFWEEGDSTRVVGERFVDEGTLLQVNQPIVSILENDPVTAVVHVIERDYPKVRIGQAAEITTDSYPDQKFTGTVVRIAPLLKESSRQARLEIEVPNLQLLLKPGMFVRAQIEFSHHENVIIIPISALVKRNGTQGVFLADTKENKARFLPVVTGIIERERVAITEPNFTGAVITIGNHLVEDDSDIILMQNGIRK